MTATVTKISTDDTIISNILPASGWSVFYGLSGCTPHAVSGIIRAITMGLSYANEKTQAGRVLFITGDAEMKPYSMSFHLHSELARLHPRLATRNRANSLHILRTTTFEINNDNDSNWTQRDIAASIACRPDHPEELGE